MNVQQQMNVMIKQLVQTQKEAIIVHVMKDFLGTAQVVMVKNYSNQIKKNVILKFLKWADINECLTNNGGCHKFGYCTNNFGSFSCACNFGYSGDGVTCSGKSLFLI